LPPFGWVYRQLDIDAPPGASDDASATLRPGDDDAMATRIVLTYADLVAMPADGKRYELHEGEIYMTAASTPRHQQVVGNLLLILAAHVRRSSPRRST
jgi:Putative restriction endonuclease